MYSSARLLPDVENGQESKEESGRELGVQGERRERSKTGGEGVKNMGLILLSQQQYVKVQGFIVADTE